MDAQTNQKAKRRRSITELQGLPETLNSFQQQNLSNKNIRNKQLQDCTSYFSEKQETQSFTQRYPHSLSSLDSEQNVNMSLPNYSLSRGYFLEYGDKQSQKVQGQHLQKEYGQEANEDFKQSVLSLTRARDTLNSQYALNTISTFQTATGNYSQYDTLLSTQEPSFFQTAQDTIFRSSSDLQSQIDIIYSQDSIKQQFFKQKNVPKNIANTPLEQFQNTDNTQSTQSFTFLYPQMNQAEFRGGSNISLDTIYNKTCAEQSQLDLKKKNKKQRKYNLRIQEDISMSSFESTNSFDIEQDSTSESGLIIEKVRPLYKQEVQQNDLQLQMPFQEQQNTLKQCEVSILGQPTIPYFSTQESTQQHEFPQGYIIQRPTNYEPKSLGPQQGSYRSQSNSIQYIDLNNHKLAEQREENQKFNNLSSDHTIGAANSFVSKDDSMYGVHFPQGIFEQEKQTTVPKLKQFLLGNFGRKLSQRDSQQLQQLKSTRNIVGLIKSRDSTRDTDTQKFLAQGYETAPQQEDDFETTQAKQENNRDIQLDKIVRQGMQTQNSNSFTSDTTSIDKSNRQRELSKDPLMKSPTLDRQSFDDQSTMDAKDLDLAQQSEVQKPFGGIKKMSPRSYQSSQQEKYKKMDNLLDINERTQLGDDIPYEDFRQNSSESRQWGMRSKSKSRMQRIKSKFQSTSTNYFMDDNLEQTTSRQITKSRFKDLHITQNISQGFGRLKQSMNNKCNCYKIGTLSNISQASFRDNTPTMHGQNVRKGFPIQSLNQPKDFQNKLVKAAKQGSQQQLDYLSPRLDKAYFGDNEDLKVRQNPDWQSQSTNYSEIKCYQAPNARNIHGNLALQSQQSSQPDTTSNTQVYLTAEQMQSNENIDNQRISDEQFIYNSLSKSTENVIQKSQLYKISNTYDQSQAADNGEDDKGQDLAEYFREKQKQKRRKAMRSDDFTGNNQKFQKDKDDQLGEVDLSTQKELQQGEVEPNSLQRESINLAKLIYQPKQIDSQQSDQYKMQIDDNSDFSPEVDEIGMGNSRNFQTAKSQPQLNLKEEQLSSSSEMDRQLDQTPSESMFHRSLVRNNSSPELKFVGVSQLSNHDSGHNINLGDIYIGLSHKNIDTELYNQQPIDKSISVPKQQQGSAAMTFNFDQLNNSERQKLNKQYTQILANENLFNNPQELSDRNNAVPQSKEMKQQDYLKDLNKRDSSNINISSLVQFKPVKRKSSRPNSIYSQQNSIDQKSSRDLNNSQLMQEKQPSINKLIISSQQGSEDSDLHIGNVYNRLAMQDSGTSKITNKCNGDSKQLGNTKHIKNRLFKNLEALKNQTSSPSRSSIHRSIKTQEDSSIASLREIVNSSSKLGINTSSNNAKQICEAKNRTSFQSSITQYNCDSRDKLSLNGLDDFIEVVQFDEQKLDRFYATSKLQNQIENTFQNLVSQIQDMEQFTIGSLKQNFQHFPTIGPCMSSNLFRHHTKKYNNSNNMVIDDSLDVQKQPTDRICSTISTTNTQPNKRLQRRNYYRNRLQQFFYEEYGVVEKEKIFELVAPQVNCIKKNFDHCKSAGILMLTTKNLAQIITCAAQLAQQSAKQKQQQDSKQDVVEQEQFQNLQNTVTTTNQSSTFGLTQKYNARRQFDLLLQDSLKRDEELQDYQFHKRLQMLRRSSSLTNLGHLRHNIRNKQALSLLHLDTTKYNKLMGSISSQQNNNQTFEMLFGPENQNSNQQDKKLESNSNFDMYNSTSFNPLFIESFSSCDYSQRKAI